MGDVGFPPHLALAVDEVEPTDEVAVDGDVQLAFLGPVVTVDSSDLLSSEVSRVLTSMTETSLSMWVIESTEQLSNDCSVTLMTNDLTFRQTDDGDRACLSLDL